MPNDHVHQAFLPPTRPTRLVAHGIAARGVSTPDGVTPDSHDGSAVSSLPASLLDRLNAEWAEMCASPSVSMRVRSWGGTCATLADCRTLSEVVDLARAAARQDEVLGALLRLGQAGDSLALRVVFQLFLGAAVNSGVTRTRVSILTYDEAAQDAVVALWGAVATYPLKRRPAKIAANLKMEIVRRLARSAADREARDVEVPADPSRARVFDQPLADDEATTPYEDVLEIIAWGVDTGTLSLRDAQLLLDVYCPAPGESGGPASASALWGISQWAVRQRCSRAVRGLSMAVAGRLR
jgi:hypothetical protein